MRQNSSAGFSVLSPGAFLERRFENDKVSPAAELPLDRDAPA